MTTDDIDAVIAGLTEAQREAIVNCEWRGSGEGQFALVNCVATKLTGRFAHMFTLRWDKLTPDGLTLRARLQEQQP